MIDLSKLALEAEDYDDFMALCDNVYTYIVCEDGANLFEVVSEFPCEGEERLALVLNQLNACGSIRNGSKGYEVAGPSPEYAGYEDAPVPATESADAESGCENRKKDRDLVAELREIESNLGSIVMSEAFYNPSHELEDYIESKSKSTTRTVLEKFFVDLCDVSDLFSEYSDARSIIERFCESYKLNGEDRENYNRYSISRNTFVYLFNRTDGYLRLFQSTLGECGYGDLLEKLFDTTSDSFLIGSSPGSDERMDVRGRLKSVLDAYMHKWGRSPESFTESALAVMENSSHDIDGLIRICKSYLSLSGFDYHSNDPKWYKAMDRYIIADGCVKHLTSDNIDALREILDNEPKLGFGVTVDKLYDVRKDDFKSYYLDTPSELVDFIRKYTGYKMEGDRILKDGTLEDAIKAFIIDRKNFDKQRIKKMYGRSCGGLNPEIVQIIDGIDVNEFSNDSALTEDEAAQISDKLKGYEWVSWSNARSIFSDIFGLGGKFSERNMHDLGFACLRDAFYRSNYGTFSNCVLHNEFMGDDIYVDDNGFKVKTECKDFAREIENLQRKKHWIPVSKYRYINLKSDKYKRFAAIYSKYCDYVMRLCETRFVTSYLLKNTECGIPEIDDDDYDLAFYGSVLLSTGVHHQTLSGHRFYHQPTESSQYQCTAPEFIRYLVYEGGGIVSVSEIQAVLDSDYGIFASESSIRNQVKLSTCRYSAETDYAYLDNDMYLEALNDD